MRRPARALRMLRSYLVAMMAPSVVVNIVLPVLPGVESVKSGWFETSMRLSSISVSLLAATYDRFSVADSGEVGGVGGPIAGAVPEKIELWLSPKYSPRSAMANGSAATHLMPRFTPYQLSSCVPIPLNADSWSKSPLSAKLRVDVGLKSTTRSTISRQWLSAPGTGVAMAPPPPGAGGGSPSACSGPAAPPT